MPIRSINVLALFAIILVFVPGNVWGQNRVDAKEALTHVVKRVDPERTPEAVAAKVGGSVYADVIVRTDGTVESIKILAGPEMLRATALAALKQWTFSPFLQGGKAARIITMVEIPFADPIRIEEQQAYENFRSAEYQCRRQLESSPQTAPAACEEAVRAAGQLPPERRLERSTQYAMHGQSLVANGRFDDALKAFDMALVFRRGNAGLADEGMAYLFELIAITHAASRDFPKAEAAFESAVSSYEGAIAQTSSRKEDYTERLRGTLQRYSNLKRATGDPLAAAALKARADALPQPRPPVAAALSGMRIIAGVRVMGNNVEHLSEDDIRQIRAVMPKGAPPIWLLITSTTYSDQTWRVNVFLEPDRVTPEFRRGRLVPVSGKLQAMDVVTGPKTWVQNIRITAYLQTPTAGTDPLLVMSERDPNRPIEIIPMADLDIPSDDEILSIVRFIRGNALKTSTATPPRLSTDIQPWTLTHITRWSSGDTDVWLMDPNAGRGQSVKLRRNGDSWTILELR